MALSRVHTSTKAAHFTKLLLLSHHQKCWSLIGWNQVTWPAL